MILLFTPGGRTGNQLFQIAYALSKRRNREWIITTGFGKTRTILDGSWKRRWLNFEGSVARSFAERVLYPILYHAFASTGLATSHFGRSSGFIVRRGKLRRLTIMKGYFESSKQQARDLRGYFRLKESLLRRVRPILAGFPRTHVPVFVHIRRADLLQMKGKGNDPKMALPDRYYLEAVEIMRSHCPQAFFVVVGDDPGHAESLLRGVEPKWISHRTVEEDLALMSLCDGGVLSNSTLSWWGAFFSNPRLGCIAPRYWSGWPIREWHPPEIRASFMTEFVDVV